MSNPAFVAEIEQNLLGAILSGGDHRPTLARLTPDHFVEPAHAEIYRLTYQSQREPSHYRTLAIAQRRRIRYGGSGTMMDRFPSRPKGMHNQTYVRLLASDLALTNLAPAIFRQSRLYAAKSWLRAGGGIALMKG